MCERAINTSSFLQASIGIVTKLRYNIDDLARLRTLLHILCTHKRLAQTLNYASAIHTYTAWSNGVILSLLLHKSYDYSRRALYSRQLLFYRQNDIADVNLLDMMNRIQ